MAIYKSPRGNFTNFLNRLELILQKLYNRIYNITCGDVNVNYLIDNNRNSQLGTVLHYYNLSCIVKSPTRIDLKSHTAIDNVYIDTSNIGKYVIYLLINGVSDHDAQLLIINRVQKQQ